MYGECRDVNGSRELYEVRNRRNEGHNRDFLTVGGMGHSSSIALGVALTNTKLSSVICIDGDGSLLMHMGTLPVITGMSHGMF